MEDIMEVDTQEGLPVQELCGESSEELQAFLLFAAAVPGGGTGETTA